MIWHTRLGGYYSLLMLTDMRKFVVYFSILAFVQVSPIAGRGTWNTSVGNYEYYASPSRTYYWSYNSSLEECRRMDGTLALITSAVIQSFFNNLVTSGSLPYAFYIGLQYLTKDGTFVWDDGAALDYVNWAEGKPDNGGAAKCVVAGDSYTYHDDFKWDDVACDAKESPAGVFCQRLIGKIWANWGEWSKCSCPGQRLRVRNCTDSGRPGPDFCMTSEEPAIENGTCWMPDCNIITPAITTTARPLGRGNWFANGSFEYYVSAASEAFSYVLSQRKCQDEDGELALVKSPLVQSFISSLVSDGSGLPYGFYIGLKYDEEKNGFFWSDGSPVEYNHWQDGEPNRNTNILEDCVGVGYNFNYKEGLPWYDYACDIGSTGKKGSVCQRQIGWHWSEWTTWTNCNCWLLKERTRNCTYSHRPGPNSCTSNSILATEFRNCSMSDISCLTTETSKDITLGHITPPGTESETTLSAIPTIAFSSSSDEIEEKDLPFFIPIVVASGGLLFLVVVGITGFCLLRRKTAEKNKESKYDATNENPMGHEYETIPRRQEAHDDDAHKDTSHVMAVVKVMNQNFDVEDALCESFKQKSLEIRRLKRQVARLQDQLISASENTKRTTRISQEAEREYENICIMKQQTDSEQCTLDLEGSKAIFKTPRSDEALYETPTKIDNRKDTFDHTRGCESVDLQASESGTKDESEYTVMKPSIRLLSAPRRPQGNDGYVTMHVVNEGENKELNTIAPIVRGN